MPQFSKIIFDLGNVIIRVRFDDCLKIWSSHTGLAPEHFKERFVQDEVYARHERNEVSGEAYRKHLCKLFEVEIPKDVFLAGWDAILGEVIEETEAFIKEFHGKINFYVFSNSNVMHRLVWSKKYEPVLRHFDRVYCSSQLGHRKPDSEGFLQILNEIQARPEEVIFVGG